MLTALAFILAVVPAFASAITIDVQVGANGTLQYSPNNIAAAAADVVVFHFNPKNHTVTQSSFGSPCGRLAGGINSGFFPVDASATEHPTFSVTVNDTQPVWFYCAQGAGTDNSHCGKGMVFAINCGQDGAANSFANFTKAAMASGGSSGGNPSLTTAAYGGVTIPAEPTPSTLTGVITLGTSTWSTTYRSYPNSPGPTPAALDGRIHTVKVGASGLVFDPPHLAAQPRDTIVFEFHQKNHTVTQSSFGAPCLPLVADGVKPLDSGFIPVASNATTFPTYNFTVTNTEPLWAYCRQATHCGQGMVFAINSDELGPRNFAAFQDLAKRLNGTGAAQPSSTPSTSDSSQIGFGIATLLFPLVFFVFAL